uniref:NADH-ubiquinone oxidoreductase 12 kDa subunit, mitochondrial n=1 Tax=Bionectria ochroleuca TaxID=29856 RepID=A0A8H7TL31_BIOOC
MESTTMTPRPSRLPRMPSFEQWVGAMMIRLVGEELGKCYNREGVNHLENCGKLRERYLQLLETNKIPGTKGLQLNYITKRDEEIDLEAKVHPINKIAKLREDPKNARP